MSRGEKDSRSSPLNFQVETMTQAFNYAVKKFGSRECLGTREVLGIEDEMQKNGKVFQKLALGDYKWISYDQVSWNAYDCAFLLAI